MLATAPRGRGLFLAVVNLDVPEAQVPGWKKPSSAACEGWEGAGGHPGVSMHPNLIAVPSRRMGWACLDMLLPLATVQKREAGSHPPHETAGPIEWCWGMVAAGEGSWQAAGQAGPWKDSVSLGFFAHLELGASSPWYCLAPTWC